MRTWSCATRSWNCGYCGEEIPVGDAILVFTFPRGIRALVRCAGCADEPAPAIVQPFLTQLRSAIRELTPLRDVAVTSLGDFKARQVGNRELGEDDV